MQRCTFQRMSDVEDATPYTLWIWSSQQEEKYSGDGHMDGKAHFVTWCTLELERNRFLFGLVIWFADLVGASAMRVNMTAIL